MGYWFYISHLEVEPITGRERFSIVSPKQLQQLSNMEFQAVNYLFNFIILVHYLMFLPQICLEFANYIVPTDHPLYNRVKRVANRLLIANKNMPQIYTKMWTITVLNDPGNVNAFVLPVSLETCTILIFSILIYYTFCIYFQNGNIFVFTGMLDICSTDDELGIVLGHEMSHSLLGHAV